MKEANVASMHGKTTTVIWRILFSKQWVVTTPIQITAAIYFILLTVNRRYYRKQTPWVSILPGMLPLLLNPIPAFMLLYKTPRPLVLLLFRQPLWTQEQLNNFVLICR